MNVITGAVGWFLGLGPTVMVPIILIILGLVFRVGWQKAVRGGITTGIGLAGLFLIVDLIVAALQPAVEALATRLNIQLALIDVNWADAGIAWGWPGVAASSWASSPSTSSWCCSSSRRPSGPTCGATGTARRSAASSGR